MVIEMISEKEMDVEIKKCVGDRNYKKGKRFDVSKIKFNRRTFSDGIIYFVFKVQSEYYWYRDYELVIGLNNNHICGARCDCSYEGRNGNCEHVACALINYKNNMFNVSANQVIKEISSSIMNQMKREVPQKNNIVKEEIGLDVIFRFYGNNPYVFFKIGVTQKYVLKSKLVRFLDAYRCGNGVVEFGKKLTYDASKYYFNDKDKAIIDFFADYFLTHRYYETEIELDNGLLKKLIVLLDGKSFEIEGIGVINNIYDTFPLTPVVRLDDDGSYVLDMSIDSAMYSFTSDYEYVIYNGNVYHLSKKNASLLMKMVEKGIDKLIFDEKDLGKFTNYVIPAIKDNVVIDESIDNIVVVKKPDVKLFFDIFSSSIVCNLKLLYKDKEIDYFSRSKNIVRDVEYEDEVLSDLVREHFKVDDKKIVLDDIDDIGYFMEESLPRLVEKYDTYTSKKLDETNIIRKFNINSMFSIGVDNIMNFTFELDGISNKEIDSIFKSLKDKKKYFKLKNGNILKLEGNNDVDKFGELIDDLELTKENLIDGNVEIPKYRAIYLDSLHDKYSFVKTNNLFDDFINKFKEYKDVSLGFSTKEKSVLRDYQLTGVKWLYNIQKCDFGGILADEMGLGKSIQIIYFLKRLINEDKESKYLIVVPTSLVYNWENEFKKFAPRLNYHIFAGIKQNRHDELLNANTNIYITSYGLLREDYEEFYSKIDFKVCIIDEAQNIKNPMAGTTKTVKKIKAETKIALTGTPIENSVMELWSIFDFIMPGFLAGAKKFQSRYKVHDFDDDTNKRLFGLNKLISPFILRRKKSEVLKDLPDKIENNIYIDLSREQKKLYAAEVKRVNEEMEMLIATEGFEKARFMILQLLTKLRQLCIDPNLIYDGYDGESTKIENLLKVVQESIDNGHKILIFTSFKKALDLVVNAFEKEGIRTYSIDGGVLSKKRMCMVNKFNDEDDVKVFVITLKSGGTGLNLTGADIVIHLDLWWNPQAENQATDRAHRIGQKNVVEVIKLVAKGTIEERILELQEKKKMLSDKLIEGNMRDTNMISSLTEKDIKKLLAYENND